jgi:hypothetical protein
MVDYNINNDINFENHMYNASPLSIALDFYSAHNNNPFLEYMARITSKDLAYHYKMVHAESVFDLEKPLELTRLESLVLEK